MKKNRTIGLWVLPVLSIGIFGITQLFIRFPLMTERYYSRGIYPILATCISFVSKWVPFSLDDVFYLLLILTAIFLAVLLIIRKISFKWAGFIVMNVVAATYIMFYLFWGFNYFRADINSRLEIESRVSDPDEFMAVFSRLIAAANESYTSYDDFDEADAARLVEDSYRQLAPVLKLDYPGGYRRAKPVTLSGFFAQAGISGYFGPFFNEVHINSKLLPVEYPFVLAHEKAHQFGITGEAEANFYAWLVCSKSDSKMLQYSANLVAVRYFMNHGYRLEGFSEVVSKLDERVIQDIREIQQHWMNFRNEKVETIAARVNDAYLKTNQVEKGIKDYTGIVKHIMDFSHDSTFQKRAGF